MPRRTKFEAVGYHPIVGHPLNVVAQINQTWSFLVVLAAARQLLTLHPAAGGFRLTRGAHATQKLDIRSGPSMSDPRPDDRFAVAALPGAQTIHSLVVRPVTK
jgi:hypothetical protein